MGVRGPVPQPRALRLYLRDPWGHGGFEDVGRLQLRSREVGATRRVPVAHGRSVAGRADPQASPILLLYLQTLLLLPERQGREQGLRGPCPGTPWHREVVQGGAPGLQEGVGGAGLVPRGAGRRGVEVRGSAGGCEGLGLAREGLEGSARRGALAQGRGEARLQRVGRGRAVGIVRRHLGGGLGRELEEELTGRLRSPSGTRWGLQEALAGGGGAADVDGLCPWRHRDPQVQRGPLRLAQSLPFGLLVDLALGLLQREPGCQGWGSPPALPVGWGRAGGGHTMSPRAGPGPPGTSPRLTYLLHLVDAMSRPVIFGLLLTKTRSQLTCSPRCPGPPPR